MASPLIGKYLLFWRKIFVFFTDSSKRNQHLKKKCKEVKNCSETCPETRWTARSESVQAAWRCLDILSALDAITEAVDFISGIMFIKNVMYRTKSFADYLKGEAVDVNCTLITMESTYDCL